jgi:DNA polymerase
MRYIIDFETYYDDEYSLKNLSVEGYVNHEKFQILSLGYANLDGGPVGFVWGEDNAREVLQQLNVASPETQTFAHNMAFDGYIANKILGFENKIANPICSVGMAKWQGCARVVGARLANLIAYACPGQAKADFLVNHKGLTLQEYIRDPNLSMGLSTYCKNDVEITRDFLRKIINQVPDVALEMIAMSIRMYIDPVLELDLNLLEEYKKELEVRQRDCLASMQKYFGIESEEHFLKLIRSKDNFVMLLERLGSPIPMKKSEAKAAKVLQAIEEGKALVQKYEKQDGELNVKDMRRLRACRQVIKHGDMIPALAKTDLGFMELMNSDDEKVAQLCRIRAESNSSIAMSRCETLIDIAKRSRKLPVPLAPFKALTGRYTAGVESESKSDGINLQNLPKRSGDKTLRQAIKAPAGYKLVAGDSAQIEARVGAWIAGEHGLIDLFKAGGDPYVDMASDIYGETYATILQGAKTLKQPTYVNMRNVGKETVLSSQYGIGWQTFGTRLLQKGVRLATINEDHYSEAKRIITLYRNKFRALTQFRYDLDNVLEFATTDVKDKSIYRYNLEAFCPLCRMNLFYLELYSECAAIRFPNDYKLVYTNLHKDKEGEFVYDHLHFGRKEVKHLYGGALFNNLTQGLAFAVLWDQALRINQRYRVIANVHDSWITLVKEAEIAEAEKYIYECLITPPSWAADLPLDANVASSYNYEIA